MWWAQRSDTAYGEVGFKASGTAEIATGTIIGPSSLPVGMTVTDDSGFPADLDNVDVIVEVDGMKSTAQFFFEEDVASIEEWQQKGWMCADGTYSEEPCG